MISWLQATKEMILAILSKTQTKPGLNGKMLEWESRQVLKRDLRIRNQ